MVHSYYVDYKNFKKNKNKKIKNKKIKIKIKSLLVYVACASRSGCNGE